MVSRTVRARPRLLLYNGELQDEALQAERVSAEEVESAVRGAGHRDLAAVKAVVMEADASLSVIGHGPGAEGVLDRVGGGENRG